MRDAENVTVRLSDYRPPDYLIDNFPELEALIHA